MARAWQLQEAKNRFSEVVEEALERGPQVITRRGVETAVVLGYKDYRRMVLDRRKLSDFFRESPLAGVELELERDRSPARDDAPL
ncbi:MAG: type II toxin-antitoxin system Phd/YefM family antitoxin [Rubrobacteraceae bacterium]